MIKSYLLVIKMNKKREAKSDANVNDTNAPTSCADEVLMDAGNVQDNKDSSFVDISSKSYNLGSDVSSRCDEKSAKTFATSKLCGNIFNSKNPNVGKFKPQKFVKVGDIPLRPRPCPNKCGCSCACGNSLKNPYGQGPSHNLIYLKRQTCFNCGIARHIARNCPHRPYVPFYTQSWLNMPKGRSSKRKPSRLRSRDGDWNAAKAKNQAPRI
ncbi:hypothetical protein L1887_07146 [Cichorium endivia]|nr:hypothetical protein L1887_07146 [Cichorium endivia]